MKPLAPWLMPLPDAETMRAVDRWAIDERGIDGLELMERAGAAVTKAVQEITSDGPVTVLCGKGNNGGDGLIAARMLHQAGHKVNIVCSSPPHELTGDARESLKRLRDALQPLRPDGTAWGPSAEGLGTTASSDGPPLDLHADLLGGAEVIVDALLGTGFDGEPRGEVAMLIGAANDSLTPILCIDVPSGVDASSGAVRGLAIKATATVTFHAAKPGLWINPGKSHVGTLQTVDIGIPRGAPMQADIGLITDSVLDLLPVRGGSSTKFDSGHVLVLGGSVGLSGAPAMAARAAMRAGAGYVTALVPASLQPILAAGATPELMTRALPEADGSLSEAALPDVLRESESGRGGALALGPGLGRGDGAAALARRLARESELALVLDADGLNAHAGRLNELTSRSAPTVLTPHGGELGRLLELGSAEIAKERLRYVREAARACDAVVLLKGDDTLIADPGGQVAVSEGGSPALATAGTGDVLTGVIAALLSQQLAPFLAAAAGVLLHARAGRLAALHVGAPDGVIASDVIEALPSARHSDGREGVHSHG